MLPKVILLAGGESSRFWPLSHKMLTPFLGKPLILWHLEQLARLKFKEIVIVVSEKNKEEIYKLTKSIDIKASFVSQSGAGQDKAILAAKELLDDKAILVFNASDIYQDSFISEMIYFWQKQPDRGVMGAVKMTSYFPGGYLKVGPDGLIKDIIEKPGEGREPSDIVRIVADIFPSGRQLVASIETRTKNNPISGYEEAIVDLIKNGFECSAFVRDTAWNKLKYPWDVLTVSDFFLTQIKTSRVSKKITIATNVILEGPVVLEEGVKIFENTKIVGPCYIGKNTIIGNNCIIRASGFGNNCVVGFNTDITRSYIDDNCWFHSNYIGDSVLGKNVSLGSGAVLANLRLDEREIFSVVKGERINTHRNKLGAIVGNDVRIGVNASVMPGVKIGTNSFVGSGVILDKDLPQNSFCIAKGGYEVIPNTKSIHPDAREKFKKHL